MPRIQAFLRLTDLYTPEPILCRILCTYIPLAQNLTGARMRRRYVSDNHIFVQWKRSSHTYIKTKDIKLAVYKVWKTNVKSKIFMRHRCVLSETVPILISWWFGIKLCYECIALRAWDKRWKTSQAAFILFICQLWSVIFLVIWCKTTNNKMGAHQTNIN